MASQLGSSALAEPGALVVHGALSWLKCSSGGTALAEPGAGAAALASRTRPSSGAKEFGKTSLHRHVALSETGALPGDCSNVLHAVMEWTSLPPCAFGRVDAWLFKVMCHRMWLAWYC